VWQLQVRVHHKQLINPLTWATCALVLGVGVWWDVKTHRIPNLLIVIAILAAGIISVLPNSGGFQNAALGGLVGLMIFMPFYLIRILGGGDVKLLAAIGCFVGYPGILAIAFYTTVIGGVLSLMMVLYHRQFYLLLIKLRYDLYSYFIKSKIEKRIQDELLNNETKRFPYAIAIAIGTIVYWYIN
jgi:prepilin peptidase CpaA